MRLEPSIDTDKLSYEIFSILESKFLFGYDDQKLWVPKNLPSPVEDSKNDGVLTSTATENIQAIKINGEKYVSSALMVVECEIYYQEKL